MQVLRACSNSENKKKKEETPNILRKDQIFLACILERYTMSILREPLTHWDRLGPTGKYQQERLAASGTYISVMCTLTKKPYSFMVHWPRPASSHSIFSFFFWSLSCCSSTPAAHESIRPLPALWIYYPYSTKYLEISLIMWLLKFSEIL